MTAHEELAALIFWELLPETQQMLKRGQKEPSTPVWAWSNARDGWGLRNRFARPRKKKRYNLPQG